MKKLLLMVFFWTFLVISLDANILGDTNGNNNVLDLKDFTVFVFSQSNPSEEDPQVYELKPDINIRAIQKWSTMGDEISDYNYKSIKHYHNHNISFIGGGTTSVIFEKDFSSPEIFRDMTTRDANNHLVPHNEIVPDAYRGSLANPRFRKYIIDWCKIQIDGGVDGLFFDEVIAGFSGGAAKNYNGNEGFDDYCITDFNKYLVEKYPTYTRQDWKNNFGMTDNNIIKKEISPADLVNNFNYRKYLQEHGWNGAAAVTSPLISKNPLTKEWGVAVNNRMYKADTFLGEYTARYWQEIVSELREYASQKYNKYILITSNGILPFVDFNCLGMYDWNPDEQTPDGRGADYVPITNKHLNGSKSLMPIYKTLYHKNRETAGNVPLVTFIDWPTEMMDNYNKLPIEEKKDYWRIFGAESYACGLYPAFHLKDTVGGLTATDAGIIDFYKEYMLFYKKNKEIYGHQNYHYSDLPVSVNKNNIAQNLMLSKDGTKYALHLINHNYKKGIFSQQNFTVTVALNKTPRHVCMISPDFRGKKDLAYEHKNNQLLINVNNITYYNVIVIE